MEYAVEIKNVTKRFKECSAVDNITVSFEKGKIHGLIGRNGSGKTVLFKCICGLYPVTQGEIIVFNQRIGDGKTIPQNIGAVIDTPGFLQNYSGYQNLRYLMELRGNVDPEKIRNAIRIVGLDPDSRKPVGKYSMGMRQRLAIAQAIMEDPALLILDEPMNGLDKLGVNDMRTLLLDLKSQGKTILIATHNPDDVSILCDTLLEMDSGKLTVHHSISEHPNQYEEGISSLSPPCKAGGYI